MEYDLIIIGGGIIGCATGKAAAESGVSDILLLEEEKTLAAHQTGNNSGVIHSGLYYKPGSYKARNCTEGREKLYRYLAEKNLPFDKCGKLVVAVNKDELTALENLHQRGTDNGLEGLKRLNREQIKELEPHCSGIAGLFVPMTGITDYKKVTESYAEDLKAGGGEIKTSAKVISVTGRQGRFTVETTAGTFNAKFIINCAGLFSDRVARLCGVDPEILIMPFRGEYYVLREEKQSLVKNLIYPVPNPELPFLGVHFTRMIEGGVEAGPNAVLAFARKGYNKTSFSLSDTLETMKFPGSLKLFSGFLKIGFYEYRRSFIKSYMVRDLQKLIPDLQSDDIIPGGAGIRAQALGKNGKLIDDFYIKEAGGMIHVLNSPSPAATASLSIGEAIASLYKKRIS